MSGWRDRYRAVDEAKTAAIDSTGVLPDGRRFTGIREAVMRQIGRIAVA